MTTDYPELHAYVECALWTSIDEQPDGNGGPPMDENYGPEDVAPVALAAMDADVRAFITENAGDLLYLDPRKVGHDFWLTRNRHGAGFWDRGLGERGKRLTDAARAYGECGLYVGDDGRVYCS